MKRADAKVGTLCRSRRTWGNQIGIVVDDRPLVETGKWERERLEAAGELIHGRFRVASKTRGYSKDNFSGLLLATAYDPVRDYEAKRIAADLLRPDLTFDPFEFEAKVQEVVRNTEWSVGSWQPLSTLGHWEPIWVDDVVNSDAGRQARDLPDYVRQTLLNTIRDLRYEVKKQRAQKKADEDRQRTAEQDKAAVATFIRQCGLEGIALPASCTVYDGTPVEDKLVQVKLGDIGELARKAHWPNLKMDEVLTG